MLGIRIETKLAYRRTLFGKEVPDYYSIAFYPDERGRKDLYFFSSPEIRAFLSRAPISPRNTLGGIVIFLKNNAKRGAIEYSGVVGYSGQMRLENGVGMASLLHLKAAELLQREVPSVQTLRIRNKEIPLANVINHFKLKIARNRYQRGKKRPVHSRERRKEILRRIFARFGPSRKMRK